MPDAPRVGQHYGDTSIKEDITDIIFQITPTDTPIMNMIPRGSATGIIHEWQKRELTTRQVNANFEGAVYTFTAENTRATRVYNTAQFLFKEVRVSSTLEALDKAGIGSQIADQSEIASIELKTDMEHAIVAGTMATGATGTARSMAGLIQAITSAVTSHTTSTGITLSENAFNDFLQTCYDNGAAPRDWFAGGRLKRTVSGFTASSTSFIAADQQRVVNTISVYESDFFVVEMHLTRDLPNASVTQFGLLGLDRSQLKMAMLRPIVMIPTAKVASSTDAVIEAEGTLEFGNQLAHFYADGIAPGV